MTTDRYDALHVRETDGKAYFTKLGAMFRNRNGDGFTLVLDVFPACNDGQYRILLKPPQERDQGRGNPPSHRATAARPASHADDLDDDLDSVPF